MDFAEPEEHRALRAAVAATAAKFGPRYYAERAGARRPCAELWQALGDAGFIGVNIPQEYGGGGGGLTELALVCEEIAAAGTPLLLLLTSAAISAEMISDFGTGEQRVTWLPGLASGAVKVVFAITEPDAGSNTLRISTTARRDGDDWVLDGTKYYISGVDEAQALLVVARTGQDERGARLSLFVVPADAPGLGQHLLPVDLLLPERQFTLHFDGVRVGPGALVGEEGEGFRQVFHGLNPERVTGAALGVGIARYALGAAARYASEHTVWAEPAGSLLAPMPGLVLRVLAEPGAVVTAGQPLLVLEAMKMEQTVSAPADGVLAELRAKAGEQVSTGQVLAVLEPGD